MGRLEKLGVRQIERNVSDDVRKYDARVITMGSLLSNLKFWNKPERITRKKTYEAIRNYLFQRGIGIIVLDSRNKPIEELSNGYLQKRIDRNSKAILFAI